jgi:tetrahydromethanopterin S-methyltransferase subunit B
MTLLIDLQKELAAAEEKLKEAIIALKLQQDKIAQSGEDSTYVPIPMINPDGTFNNAVSAPEKPVGLLEWDVQELTKKVEELQDQIDQIEQQQEQQDNTANNQETPTNNHNTAKIVGSVIIGLIAGAVAGYFLLPVFAALLATVVALALTATASLGVAVAVGAGSHALMSMFGKTVGDAGGEDSLGMHSTPEV